MRCVAAGAADASKSVAADALFREGKTAYEQAAYPSATALFQAAALRQPAAGTFQNLGNAAWQAGPAGPAILAWERALWIDPRDEAARDNLRFARQKAELEEPRLAWFEVCSTWLPFNAWAWIAGVSLWLSLALLLLPSVMRWRRRDVHQALAAAAVAALLLSLPGMAGIHARARLGFIQPQEVPLRLTPTREAQLLARLPSGEPARLEARRGEYVFVRTRHAAGWVGRGDFATISDNSSPQ